MRLCRFLRSLEPESEGGLPGNEFVTISRAEFDELRATRSDFDEALGKREAAHARELAAREQRSAELERAYKTALLDRELATALIGKPLVPGAATQLIKLWRDDFEVIDDGSEIRILARDGRGIDQAISDRLTGPEFAHFCLASSRGGTGSKGQNRSASPASRPTGPKNLGEAILIQWREAASRPQASSLPSGWGRRR